MEHTCNFYIVPQEPTKRKHAILNGHIFGFGTAYFLKALGYLWSTVG
jgi:hypothetical protein